MVDKKYTLRIPEELHSKIGAMAQKERRSLHAQMLVMLQEAIEARQQAQKPDEKSKQ